MSRVSIFRGVALSALLLAVGCGGCQVQVNKTFGVFVLTPQVLDFHTVCLNSTSEFPLSLRNDGQGIVKIKSFTFSDAAFTLLDEMPGTIPPRKTVVVRVGFTPTEARAYSAFFTVETDTNKNATQQATLLGTGFNGEDVDFEVSCWCTSMGASGLFCGTKGQGQEAKPCHFLSFGQVIAGQSAEATVTVHNRGCQPVQFTQAQFYDETDPPSDAALFTSWFSLDPAAPATIRGGESQDYVVRFEPTIDGLPNVRLKLLSNDPSPLHPNQTEKGAWDLGLFGESVKPALFVDPLILTFFDAVVGTTTAPKNITIDNTGTARLHVDSVVLTEDNGTHDYALQLPNGSSFDLDVGQSVTASVTLTPSGAGGREGAVTVTAGADVVKVRLLGGAEPELNVKWLDPANANTETDPPVNFGTVATGTTGTRTVRVHNNGQADLKLTNMVANDITNAQPSASFSVEGFSAATIQPGGSQDFTVKFTDDVSVRNDIGKLAITSNDPLYSGSNNIATVDLSSTNEPNYAPLPNITVMPDNPRGCMALTLDGSGSTDPENDRLSYTWAIARKPAGSTVSLATPNAATTAVTSSAASCTGPDVAGTYVFTLTVVDQYPRNSVTLSAVVTVR